MTQAKTKKERIAEAVAKAVNAGRQVAISTVDFSDPHRPKTCLEVDFPILPINQIAAIEGNAGKPIYQMSKWWARRRSSVFRAMLIAAAMKAPDDPAEAAKAVWDVYYANHQAKGALKHLKVADIFMGGGTTIVEGSRLGMQMHGNDLNPVAWFVVKNEMAKVDPEEVKALLADIEIEVKPRIMPFYACDCPRGHKGKWTKLSTNQAMPAEFDPLALTLAERRDYRYEGPEIIYVFWAKHGPCQVTGCGHRTPIMSSPVMAIKTLTVKAWENYGCGKCARHYDVEARAARMAPAAPLIVADTETPYAVLDAKGNVACPHCGHREQFTRLSIKGKNKKIELSLLVHPQWLKGSPVRSPAFRRNGSATEPLPPEGGTTNMEFGGSATDSAEATAAWNQERARQMKLIEVRGALPEEIADPETGVTFRTDQGTVPKKSNFACGSCGTVQDVLTAIKDSGKTAPIAAYSFQGYCPFCDSMSQLYGGRFFAPVASTTQIDSANEQWQLQKNNDLNGFWPESDVRYGLETAVRTPLAKYQYKYWADFFNSRQLLAHSMILKAICDLPGYSYQVRELALCGFQQFLRSNNLFCIWNIQADKLEPFLSKNNLQPPTRPVENSVFSSFGRGTWISCHQGVIEAIEWCQKPYELVSSDFVGVILPDVITELGSAKSVKVNTDDPILNSSRVYCGSATDISYIAGTELDLVITDPPFGDIMQYAELSDFFYAWLNGVLKQRYDYFSSPHTPTSLEAVANHSRHGADAGEFYKRLLTESWREAFRLLKPGGILAFTFHHDKDDPWVAVLESLFDAGFYLEATYPIRADETKGEGSTPGTFGAQKVEYDIIHVCRKRAEEPQPVSWGRMRREVLRDVRQLQQVLEHHAKQGLPAADLQVIKRGKALEYFSRHYGQVYVDNGREFTVRDALIGINQLLDEEAGKVTDPPPTNAEPMTRQFLRLFDGKPELPRDQMQKYLRGTGIAPAEFVERGWCFEEKKVYHPTPPLEIAQGWHGRHRRLLTSDLDQALFLIGACFPASGINAAETLKNENFKPHAALGALLDWFTRHGASREVKQAAAMAAQIYRVWAGQNQEVVKQMSFFE